MVVWVVQLEIWEQWLKTEYFCTCTLSDLSLRQLSVSPTSSDKVARPKWPFYPPWSSESPFMTRSEHNLFPPLLGFECLARNVKRGWLMQPCSSVSYSGTGVAGVDLEVLSCWEPTLTFDGPVFTIWPLISLEQMLTCCVWVLLNRQQDKLIKIAANILEKKVPSSISKTASISLTVSVVTTWINAFQNYILENYFKLHYFLIVQDNLLQWASLTNTHLHTCGCLSNQQTHPNSSSSCNTFVFIII